MVRSLLGAAALVSAATGPSAADRSRMRAASVVDGEVLPTSDGDAPRGVERGRKPAGGRAKAPLGARLFIPTERLMSLTADELRAVRWAAVRDGRGAAAGVRLAGVGGLGVGLAEGDVVTSIDGKPTRTEDDATAAGMAAWASGEPAVHATLLRKERVVAVTVQLPPRPTSSRM